MHGTFRSIFGSFPYLSSTQVTNFMLRFQKPVIEWLKSDRAPRFATPRMDRPTLTVARRDLRKWLRESKEGKAAEKAVEKLLGTKQVHTNPPSGGR